VLSRRISAKPHKVRMKRINALEKNESVNLRGDVVTLRDCLPAHNSCQRASSKDSDTLFTRQRRARRMAVYITNS